MIETYASAALICAASMLVGRALLAVAGHSSWSWLEPAAGLGAVLTVSGVLARAPGHGTTATVGLALLVLAAALVAVRHRPAAAGPKTPADRTRPAPRRSEGALRRGLPVAIAIALVLSIPFAVSGRWGLLGVGFNNDLGLHLAWAEWLRSGFGPSPDPGYPLGPHGLAVAAAAVPGIGLGQAFVGEIFAIGVLTGLTALAALDGLGAMRRSLAAVLVAIPYLAASYFAQGAFKEMAEALFVLAFAVALHLLDRRRAEGWPISPRPGRAAGRLRGWLRFALPYLALAGGIFFSYSFAGLAWPIAIVALWGLTVAEIRAALAPRRLLGLLLRPATLAALAGLAALAVALTLIGPFGFAHGFSKVAGYNTYGPVSPVEALGIWPASNYRLNAAGGAPLSGLAGTIAGLALALGAVWWLRRREPAAPIALGACAALYLASLPLSGDYSQAKALMIAAPLAMLVAVRPLLAELGRRSRSSPGTAGKGRTARGGGARRGAARLGWSALAAAFVAGAACSSFLALRDAPVGPPGHGAELRAFLPILHGKPVLYAGQDRYAAYELLGADTHVPLVEFADAAISANPEKPFDTGDAYGPIDFDSLSRATLDRFPYVITSSAAWSSQAPPSFRRVAATPSYLLWKRTGPAPRHRHVLLEGTEAAARGGCGAPEIRILLSNPGRAGLFPDPVVIGPKARWAPSSVLGTGGRAAQTLRLPAGRWLLSLQYFSPFPLTLTAPRLREPLKPALDGQRPVTISLANDGQFWPAGEVVSGGGALRFTIAAAQPSTLQRLSGYDGKAYLGELIAVPARPHRTVPLSQACDGWIDWYESPAAP
jgi:hypothetical protein